MIIVFPAILYASSTGSILETLTKVGSYFVGAKLGMYALGFFLRDTTEKGLLVGVAAGFAALWLVASRSAVAWPWYCAIGGGVTVAAGWLASRILTGRQTDWHELTVIGHRRAFADGALPERDGRWWRVPGRIDPASWWLLAYFAAALIALKAFEWAS